MKPKVSVVIPVYDVSKYLRKCLDSVVNQTLQDIEIILINDKSPDPKDHEICLEYEKKDERVVYIKHEKNLGLGGARNTGIEYALGEYQWHIDSDDYIAQDACEFLYNTAKESNLDILTFSGCNFVDTEGGIKYFDNYFARDKAVCDKEYKGIDFLREARARGVFHCAVWLNFMKSSFIKSFAEDYTFVENMVHQDTDHTPILYSKAEKVMCLHYTPYYRLVRDTSVTFSGITENKMLQRFDVTSRFVDYLSTEDIGTDSPLFEFMYKDFQYFKKIYDRDFEGQSEKVDTIIEDLEHRIDSFSRYFDLTELENVHEQNYYIVEELSVMVKTFLRPDMLRRFLVSIGEYQDDHKIIFNGIYIGDDSDNEDLESGLKVVKDVKETYPHLKINYYQYEFNVGNSEGRNRLIDQISSEYFLYCDDDYIMDTECDIESALDTIKTKGMSILGGYWKNLNNKGENHYLNGYFTDLEDKVICNIKSDEAPDFAYVDYLHNFYIGNVEDIKTVKWDSELKTEEHPDFFIRVFRENLKVAFTKDLMIKHEHVKRPKYEEYRSVSKSGRDYLYLRVKKAGVKKWIANYYSNKSVRTWEIDVENETSNWTNVNLEQPIYGQKVDVKRLTPKLKNYFFGYFDLIGKKSEDLPHLALEIPYMDRLPENGDKATISLIYKDGTVEEVEETSAWNFQQANYLQYLPNSDDKIIYNTFDSKAEEYRSKIYNINTKKSRVLDLPIANVASNGKDALSINFSRLYDYRPGYGYYNKSDPYYNVIAPKQDGVLHLDLSTNESKLLISYYKLWEKFARGSDREDQKIIVNHLNYSPDGSKILMLLRWFSNNAPWPTMTLVCNSDGSNIRKVFGFGSHYNWIDNSNVLISGRPPVNKATEPPITLYNLNVDTGVFETVDSDFFIGDGHCLLSPDKRYVIYDSYSSSNFPYRKLQVYDLEKNNGINLI